MIDRVYKASLALLTDLYQLTMGYGYFKKGMAEQEAVFHLFFRKNPFNGNYVVAAGLHDAIVFLRDFRFNEDDITYLRGLSGGDGKPLFHEDYLRYLLQMRFTCDVDAVPEGRVVFPHEPLMRIKGPLIQGQLFETALLNIINFQSLIATKSSRICSAAGGDSVIEFGMRRAQGIDGSLSATRAAFIGGVTATSNVLAGKIHGIPLKGTHAHSWIMSFPSEPQAFEAFAEVMPANCVFLVDTYSTIEGIKNAIEAGKKLRGRGHRLQGIRLDSGDLAKLSIAAREMLDQAGFQDADIVASNDLDEYAIVKLKDGGAKINVWGVGTRLVTAYDQPALGGVYKVAAIQEEGQWSYKIKISEEVAKISNPGLLQVRRFIQGGVFRGDVMYNTVDHGEMDASTSCEDLLKPIFRQGSLVYVEPTVLESRAQAARDLSLLSPQWRSLTQAGEGYPVALEARLQQLKTKLISAKS